MCLLTVLTVKKFEFPKSKMADGRPSEKNPLNRHISATVGPILMKFGTVTQIGPYRRQTIKMLNFSKTKMAAVAILINHKNRDITTTD